MPLYSELMARGAGANIKGIFGSQNWDWKLEDQMGSRYVGTNAFVKSFGEKYGFPPSQAAHTCYVQTLLYADAAERAGTFNPCGIVEALAGFEFDGLGNGPTLYRAEDHQCFKDVVVVKGKENPDNEFDLVEIVEVRRSTGDLRCRPPADARRERQRRSDRYLQSRARKRFERSQGGRERPPLFVNYLK